MSEATREADRLVAIKFFNRKDAMKIYDKFEGELDWELSNDMIKAGCYLTLRNKGVPATWAKISACRTVRIGAGNKEFARAQRANMAGWSDRRRNNILDAAKRAGIDTTGKMYVGALGTYDNPLAWCSSIDDAKVSAQRQGIGISGFVNYSPPEKDKPELPAIAPDIVRELALKKLRQDPASFDASGRVRSAKLRDAEQSVLAQHSGRKPKSKRRSSRVSL